MPQALRRPCPIPACPELTRGGLCARHRQLRQRDDYERRGSAQARGYTSRWNQISHIQLERYPLCGMRSHFAHAGWRGECYDLQRVTPATVTDHILPHKGDPRLFWDPHNWQSLCANCNRLKNIRYEGGFGFAPQGDHDGERTRVARAGGVCGGGGVGDEQGPIVGRGDPAVRR